MSMNNNRLRFTFEGRSSLARKLGSKLKTPQIKLSDTKDKVSAKVSNDIKVSKSRNVRLER